jgi:hypothetical protein
MACRINASGGRPALAGNHGILDKGDRNKIMVNGCATLARHGRALVPISLQRYLDPAAGMDGPPLLQKARQTLLQKARPF